jgi:tRNA wybutosine-synthesizing protein 3
MKKKEFLDAKESALKSLTQACMQGKVDEAALPILEVINNIEAFYTTSSCAGRIVLLEIPTIGDKKQATFLGIWHRTITPEEISVAAKNATQGYLWLLAQAPIVHIGAESLPLAEKMVKLAISAGFKNSAIRSIGKKIILELSSTERLDAPIGREGSLFCDEKQISLLTEISNEVIKRSTEKLGRLTKKLANFGVFP